MSLKIQIAPKYLPAIARGMLDYVNHHLDAKGLFCETFTSLGGHLCISPAYAHKIQKVLVEWGYLSIVEAPRRGRSGRYETSAVLRPTGKSPDARPLLLIESVNATNSESVKTKICESGDVIENSGTLPIHSYKSAPQGFTDSLQQSVNANTVHSIHLTESRAVGNIANSSQVGATSESVNCVACTMLGKVGVPVAQRGTNGYCQKHNNETCWLGEGE